MERRPDWPDRLHQALEAVREAPFRWGTNDCALFACDVVEAMTGLDLAADFRGRYRSQAGAGVVLKRACGGGLEALVEARAAEHGIAEVPVAFAQRGDVVLLDSEAGPALGICLGASAALPRADQGFASIDMAAARRAWAVGRSAQFSVISHQAAGAAVREGGLITDD